ncbi:MAG: RNase A-like domain-containing protein [Terriglobales bacterium]
MTQRFPIWMAAACMLSVLISCEPSRSAKGAAPTSPSASSRMEARVEAHFSAAPPRDLSRDEEAGGHVLRKHVGRSDNELRERLEREQNISGASTYTDRATAERAIGDALGQSQARIERWLNRSGGHPNLVLDYDSDQPLGRTINRGDSQSRPCSHAVVVLKYAAPIYYVLTSYPECRS